MLDESLRKIGTHLMDWHSKLLTGMSLEEKEIIEQHITAIHTLPVYEDSPDTALPPEFLEKVRKLPDADAMELLIQAVDPHETLPLNKRRPVRRIRQ